MKLRGLLVSLTLLVALKLSAQKELDSVIVVNVQDTINLYNKIKWELIRHEFIVKDLPERDTIRTYAREFMDDNYMVLTITIRGNEVRLKGVWGSRKLSWFGFSLSPKEYTRIFYYKGSKAWRVMKGVAESVGDIVSYN